MGDYRRNFGYGAVTEAPTGTPAKNLAVNEVAKFRIGKATAEVLKAGGGGVPFNATVWAAGEIPLSSNAEIVRVTGIGTLETNTQLTVERQTSTEPNNYSRTITVGDQFMAGVTAKQEPRPSETGVCYVVPPPFGNDNNTGGSWLFPKATLAAAQEALPEASEKRPNLVGLGELPGRNGVIELGFGVFEVESHARIDTVTFNVLEVADASAVAEDLGAIIVVPGGGGHNEGALIEEVKVGVGYKLNKSMSSGTEQVFIVKPGFTKQPGVTLRGRGPQNGRNGRESLNYPTLIKDLGEGVTIFDESGEGEGGAHSGATYIRSTIEELSIEGKTTPGKENLYGYLVACYYGLNIARNTFVKHGCYGARIGKQAAVGQSGMYDCEAHFCGVPIEPWSSGEHRNPAGENENKYVPGEAAWEGGKVYVAIKESKHTSPKQPSLNLGTYWELGNAKLQLTGANETGGFYFKGAPNAMYIQKSRALWCWGNGMSGVGIDLVDCESSRSQSTGINASGYGLFGTGATGDGGISLKGCDFEGNAKASVKNSGTLLKIDSSKFQGDGVEEYVVVNGQGTVILDGVISFNHTKAVVHQTTTTGTIVWTPGETTSEGGSPDTVFIEGPSGYRLSIAAFETAGVYNCGRTTAPPASTKVSELSLTGTWQNTLEKDVRLKVPLAFEAGGTCEVKIGSTSPGTSIGTIESAAAAKQILSEYVPARWFVTLVVNAKCKLTAEAIAQPA